MNLDSDFGLILLGFFEDFGSFFWWIKAKSSSAKIFASFSSGISPFVFSPFLRSGLADFSFLSYYNLMDDEICVPLIE